jgi:hypothetical protein
VLQQNYEQNNQLRALLNELSNNQRELLSEQLSLEETKQKAEERRQSANKQEPKYLPVVHYEKVLNETKAWILEQQRTNLKMSLQAISMQQSLDAERKKMAEAQAEIKAKEALEKASIDEKNGKVKANLQYVSAQRIVRFVKDHIPLETSNVSVNQSGKDQVDISYTIKWSMNALDIERMCSMFYEGGLASQCTPSKDNKTVSVYFSKYVDRAFFDPVTRHKNVWSNPILDTKAGNQKINSNLFIANDVDFSMMINVAGFHQITYKSKTEDVKSLVDSESFSEVAAWK